MSLSAQFGCHKHQQNILVFSFLNCSTLCWRCFVKIMVLHLNFSTFGTTKLGDFTIKIRTTTYWTYTKIWYWNLICIKFWSDEKHLLHQCFWNNNKILICDWPKLIRRIWSDTKLWNNKVPIFPSYIQR